MFEKMNYMKLLKVKNITIERLQEVSKLIKNEYKNEEITGKFIKKLFFYIIYANIVIKRLIQKRNH